MDINQLISTGSGITALILSVYLILKSRMESRKLGAEIVKSKPEAIAAYEAAANLAAERALKLSQRIDSLEEISDAQEKKIRELESELTLVHDWAARLCHQIQSFGNIPVSLKTKRSKPISSDE